MNFFFNNSELSGGGVKRFVERYYTSPMTEQADPVSMYWKAVCRSQLEVWALANRRTRTTLGLPGQLAASKTPNDVFGAYAAYWQNAFTEYADTTHRISELFAQPIEEAPVKNEAKQGAVVAKLSKQPRPIKVNGMRRSVSEAYREAS